MKLRAKVRNYYYCKNNAQIDCGLFSLLYAQREHFVLLCADAYKSHASVTALPEALDTRITLLDCLTAWLLDSTVSTTFKASLRY